MDNRLVTKRWIGRFARIISRTLRRRAILLYHSVDSGPMSATEEAFRAQLHWLSRHATVVPLDNILADDDAAELQVALTFDDGYESVYDKVIPILKEHRFTATVYVNTNCIADDQRVSSDEEKGHYPDERFLTWKEVIAMRDMGWTVGSHGADHVDLTRLPDEEVERQLRHSKATIEQRLQMPCTHFAYTWGRHNQLVRTAVERAGYYWAVTGQHSAVTRNCHRYAVPRIDVRKDYELEDFISVVRGDWDYMRFVQSARKLLR